MENKMKSKTTDLINRIIALAFAVLFFAMSYFANNELQGYFLKTVCSIWLATLLIYTKLCEMSSGENKE